MWNYSSIYKTNIFYVDFVQKKRRSKLITKNRPRLVQYGVFALDNLDKFGNVTPRFCLYFFSFSRDLQAAQHWP